MGYIKSVIVFAVLRRSMQAVCEAQLRVIALQTNTISNEEMSQRWQAVAQRCV